MALGGESSSGFHSWLLLSLSFSLSAEETEPEAEERKEES
jgi:hypothetical protein